MRIPTNSTQVLFIHSVQPKIAILRIYRQKYVSCINVLNLLQTISTFHSSLKNFCGNIKEKRKILHNNGSNSLKKLQGGHVFRPMMKNHFICILWKYYIKNSRRTLEYLVIFTKTITTV